LHNCINSGLSVRNDFGPKAQSLKALNGKYLVATVIFYNQNKFVIVHGLFFVPFSVDYMLTIMPRWNSQKTANHSHDPW